MFRVRLVKYVEVGETAISKTDLWLQRFIGLPAAPTEGLFVWLSDSYFEKLIGIHWDVGRSEYHCAVPSDHHIHDGIVLDDVVAVYLEKGWEMREG